MPQDLRYALRSIRRAPGLTLAIVLMLGLGIGAATAVFSVVQAVLLDPLPFPAPERLVRVWELTRASDRFSFSDRNYIDLRRAARAFSGVGAYRELGTTAVLGGAEPQRIRSVHASRSLFEVLGARPAIGRIFSEEEDRPGALSRRIVLSDGLWRRRFGARGDTIGRAVLLDGTSHVVIGVMPPGFDFPDRAEAWLPLAADEGRDRGDKELAVVGRLAPGRSAAEARAEARAIAAYIAVESPESNAGWSADLVTLRESLIGPPFRATVRILAVAVTLVLLLACANIANLLLAQATARQREMRTRAALGASHGRLVRQLLTEAALLGAFGTVLGVTVAFWSVDLLRMLGGDRVPRLDALRVDGTVLAFSCLAGVASCLVFGLFPAWHAARTDLRGGMEEGVRHTRTTRGAPGTLVAIEVALALVLLVTAGLMAVTLVNLARVDAGFDTRSVLAVPLEVPPARAAADGTAAFYETVAQRIASIPGVRLAAATSTNPFAQTGYSNSVTPEEQAADAPPSGLVQAGWRSVTPGFFATMGIPLREGRAFTSSDREDGEPVAVLSESLARRLWPGGSAVGRRIYWGDTSGRTRTIVGVAANIRDVRLEGEAPHLLFVPHQQVPVPAMTVVVNTGLETGAIARSIRGALREIAPGLPAPAVGTINQNRAQASGRQRFASWVLWTFAAVALALAALGVYAMLAFMVAERRSELAMRLVLGADPRRTAMVVLRRGLLLAAAGVTVGSAAALAATRLLRSMLFGVGPADPLTFAAAGAAMLIVAAVASYFPARQAAGIDPVVALRNE